MKQSQLKYGILLLIAMWCMAAFTAQAQSNVVWQSKKDRGVKIEQNGERYSAKGDVTEAIIKEFKTWVRQQLGQYSGGYHGRDQQETNIGNNVMSQVRALAEAKYNEMQKALETQKRVTDRKLSNQAKNGETDESRMQYARTGGNQFGSNVTANNYYGGPNNGSYQATYNKDVKKFKPISKTPSNKNRRIGSRYEYSKSIDSLGRAHKYEKWEVFDSKTNTRKIIEIDKGIVNTTKFISEQHLSVEEIKKYYLNPFVSQDEKRKLSDWFYNRLKKAGASDEEIARWFDEEQRRVDVVAQKNARAQQFGNNQPSTTTAAGNTVAPNKQPASQQTETSTSQEPPMSTSINIAGGSNIVSVVGKPIKSTHVGTGNAVGISVVLDGNGNKVPRETLGTKLLTEQRKYWMDEQVKEKGTGTGTGKRTKVDILTGSSRPFPGITTDTRNGNLSNNIENATKRSK